jgi:hypothetical protein
MQQYQNLKSNAFTIITALHVRPTRPSSGALKFWRNCCTFRATAVGVFVFTVFLNEVNVRGSSSTVTHQKLMQEEIKRTLNWSNIQSTTFCLVVCCLKI